jgi:N-methylhydantoinase B
MTTRVLAPTTITVELVRNRLEAAAREMTETLRRAAYSPLIRESLDFSTALHNPAGEVVAQSAALPFLAGAMTSAVATLGATGRLAKAEPGDIYISNDPYLAGGTHVNDIAVIVPVFCSDELTLVAHAKAHMLDVGGRDPGSWALDATDAQQEGIRIPHVRLAHRAQIDEDVMAVICSNVRFPGQLRADVQAMIAACRAGAARVDEAAARYGTEVVVSAATAILDQDEARMRTRIAELPDAIYRSSDLVETDGLTDEEIAVEVTVTVEGSEIDIDFTGSAPEARGSNGNMIFAGTEASARLALKCLLDPLGPDNDGVYRPVTVRAAPGSCVNPHHPAPVTVGLSSVAHCAIESVMRALAPVVEERAMADQFGCVQALILAGPVPGHEAPFVHFMVYPGGSGARANADGLDGVVNICDSGVRNIPAEVIESTLPVRVERMELLTDSAGPGRFRGGLGVRADYRILTEGVTGTAVLNRYRIAPRGRAGGGEGATSRTVVINRDGEERHYGFETFPVARGELVSHRTGGGGGWGTPAERDPVRVAADVHAGLLSPQAATRHHSAAWVKAARPRDGLVHE